MSSDLSCVARLDGPLATDIVLAVGNPLGLRSSVTSGIVSVPGRAVAERGGAAGLDAALAALRPGKTVNVQLVQANGARAAVDAKLWE